MNRIDTVVIGAGHAGLALSRLLTVAGWEHVGLDRGRVAERWRSERWDSLHLLSPNWLARLPGWSYGGADQDGFMSAAQFIAYLEGYAESFGAPVQSGTTVEDLSACATGYAVVTDKGAWRSRHVVIATGPWGAPVVPTGLDRRGLDRLGRRDCVLSASAYRNPKQLADGGVLVVGASASGVQIADELVRGGRRVILAVGRHTRMPRRYRGMDAYWWLERTGRLARTIDEVDPQAARAEPSLQLVGRSDVDRDTDDLDLVALQSRGVQLVGRLASVDKRGVAGFRDDLAATTAAADRTLHSFLDTVDTHIERTGLTSEVWPAMRPRRFVATATPSTRLDLASEQISTVVLAAGYRPHHPWLRLPITDLDGSIQQCRGVTSAPGAYVVGLRFQHRRDSAMIDGARHDARAVVSHLYTGSTEPASMGVPR